MLHDLTKAQKAILQYIGIRICLYTLGILEIIGITGLLVTAGILEQNRISFGGCLLQMLAIGAAMAFIGFIIWTIRTISPYILKETKRIVREEDLAAKKTKKDDSARTVEP